MSNIPAFDNEWKILFETDYKNRDNWNDFTSVELFHEIISDSLKIEIPEFDFDVDNLPTEDYLEKYADKLYVLYSYIARIQNYRLFDDKPQEDIIHRVLNDILNDRHWPEYDQFVNKFENMSKYAYEQTKKMYAYQTLIEKTYDYDHDEDDDNKELTPVWEALERFARARYFIDDECIKNNFEKDFKYFSKDYKYNDPRFLKEDPYEDD